MRRSLLLLLLSALICVCAYAQKFEVGFDLSANWQNKLDRNNNVSHFTQLTKQGSLFVNINIIEHFSFKNGFGYAQTFDNRFGWLGCPVGAPDLSEYYFYDITSFALYNNSIKYKVFKPAKLNPFIAIGTSHFFKLNDKTVENIPFEHRTFRLNEQKRISLADFEIGVRYQACHKLFIELSPKIQKQINRQEYGNLDLMSFNLSAGYILK